MLPALSVSLPYWQDRNPMDALEVAAATAELGFHQLWIGEMATFDAFALAAAVGARTGDLPLCLGPFAVDVRTPATLAMGVASVAALTGRSVDVALGTSSTVLVEQWHGRRRRSPARHLEESAVILRGLLAGEKVSYDGRIESTRGYRLRLPAPGASLTVAAFGPRALTCAARTADRVVLNLVTPAQVRRCAETLRAAARSAGRPTPRIAVWVTAALDPTPDLRTTVRRGIVGYLAAPGYREMFAEAGFESVTDLARSGAHPREILAAVPDDLPSAVGMFGDRTELTTRLAEYRAAGADEIVIVPATSATDPGGRTTLRAIADLEGLAAPDATVVRGDSVAPDAAVVRGGSVAPGPAVVRGDSAAPDATLVRGNPTAVPSPTPARSDNADGLGRAVGTSEAVADVWSAGAEPVGTAGADFAVGSSEAVADMWSAGAEPVETAGAVFAVGSTDPVAGVPSADAEPVATTGPDFSADRRDTAAAQVLADSGDAVGHVGRRIDRAAAERPPLAEIDPGAAAARDLVADRDEAAEPECTVHRAERGGRL
ncbi:LLM class F420-dependent oxidoreductase [Nocardia sp. NPDC048505]|uniref:LLM class F420-dependent oxidoreductase n=1 Tax=unclassified Nocardia TaxID=2637762 RepID=UPI0033FB617A